MSCGLAGGANARVEDDAVDVPAAVAPGLGNKRGWG